MPVAPLPPCPMYLGQGGPGVSQTPLGGCPMCSMPIGGCGCDCPPPVLPPIPVPCCPEGPAEIPETLYLTITAIQDPDLKCLTVGEVIPVRNLDAVVPGYFEWGVAKRDDGSLIYDPADPLFFDPGICLRIIFMICYQTGNEWQIGNPAQFLGSYYNVSIPFGFPGRAITGPTYFPGFFPYFGPTPTTCRPVIVFGDLLSTDPSTFFEIPAFSGVLTE